jgi:hypothetical protein
MSEDAFVPDKSGAPNAGDPAQVAARGKVVQDRAAQDALDMSEALKNAHCRRLLVRLLEYAGVYRSTWSQDSNVMAANEGRREVGLWIIAQMDASADDAYLSIMAERLQVVRSEAALAKAGAKAMPPGYETAPKILIDLP